MGHDLLCCGSTSEQLHRQQPLAVDSPRLGCRSSLRRAKAAWSCAAAAGRAQSNGRPRCRAGVMTHTSTRQAAPEPFTSPAPAPTLGGAPGRRGGRSRPGSAACGRRRRGRCRCRAGRRCGGSRWPACCLWAAAGVASTAAQRTSRGLCLVIGPRRTVVSDSRWRGVSPAQEHSCGAPAKRCTFPISATNTAASTGPPQGWPGWPGSRHRRLRPRRSPVRAS